MPSPEINSVWLNSLLDFAFPRLCLGCGIQTDSLIQVCDSCLSRIDRYTEPFCLQCKRQLFDSPDCPECGAQAWQLFAFGDYVNPLKEIVINFKFHGIRQGCNFAADAIVTQFSQRLFALEPTHLVPIPLHPWRQLSRGYNQAEILANRLGEQLNLPVASDFIQRKKHRKEQARLSEHHRAVNISGAFEAIADADPGERVILVDDVVTSGSTVHEARRVLCGAGFEVPGCIAIAHGL